MARRNVLNIKCSLFQMYKIKATNNSQNPTHAMTVSRGEIDEARSDLMQSVNEISEELLRVLLSIAHKPRCTSAENNHQLRTNQWIRQI